MLPAIQYWFGIKDALAARGIRVITTTVPASASIEERATALCREIAAAATRTYGLDDGVNVVAHSMGGLDARYMISRLGGVRVRSLVTIATPHRGSAIADAVVGTHYRLPRRFYWLAERATGLELGGGGTSAIAQLTTRYMNEQFNPRTPDDPHVRYFSYGAATRGRPPLLSPFRWSHGVLQALEGPNDGLVSVDSSRWGTYKGTLVGLNHLDLINWSNRLHWAVRGWLGEQRTWAALDTSSLLFVS